MAIRPYNGNAVRRGASEPHARGGGNTRGPISLFGDEPGGLLEGGMFGGRDPFKEFGAMDLFGGGGHANMMRGFDEMASQMMQGSGSGAGPRGGGGGGDGQYACQSFAMVSRVGPDGKAHTERYASSDIGNRGQNIRESQQAYSNSGSSTEKMALERHLGDRARKMVRERARGEDRSSEMFRGMDESSKDAFDGEFAGKAHHLPQHPRLNSAAMLAPGAMAAGRGPAALPGSGRRTPQLGNGHRHHSVPSRRR